MLTEKEKQAVERRFALDCQMAEFFHFKTLPRYFPPELGCVYAFEMSDGTIKIGITRNIEKRIKCVQCAVYLKVLRVHHTGFAPLNFMRIIETRCHATFIGREVRGEYFDVTFEEACAELDRYADEIASALADADRSFLDDFKYYEELKIEYLKKLQHVFPESYPKRSSKTAPKIAFSDNELKFACVYVLLMSDNTVQVVKIGQSKNIRSRVAKIKRETGLTVKDMYFTAPLLRDVARLVEWACQEVFSSQRVKGEFFSVDFHEVCAKVKYFLELATAAPITVDFERDDKSFKIADKKLV